MSSSGVRGLEAPASSTAMAHATIRGDASAAVIAQLVQSEGGDLAPGVPALTIAANYCCTGVVAALITAGVDVMAPYRHAPFEGWTALHFACIGTEHDAAAIATLLLAAGARTDVPAADGLLPADVACAGSKVAAALLAAGSPARGAPDRFAKSSAGLFLRMMSSLSALSPSCAAEALLESERPCDMMRWSDVSGRTALHIASFAGSPLLCTWCLENGADVNARDLTGATPLRETLVSYLPAPPVVRLLCSHGAIPCEDDVRLAVKVGIPNIVSALIHAGAPCPAGVPATLVSMVRPVADAADDMPLYAHPAFLLQSLIKHNTRALEAAVRTGAHDLTYALAVCSCLGTVDQLLVLIRAGADVNGRVAAASAMNGSTALHAAAACGIAPRERIISHLVASGADINAPLPCGLTALDVAQHHSVRQLLRQLGGAPAPDSVRKSAAASSFLAVLNAVEALRTGDDDAFKRQVAAGVHPDQADLSGETALHHLGQAQDASASLVMWLVQAGADVDKQSWDGSTALHRAVAVDNARLADLLLSCGADVAATDWLGFTAGRLAAYAHHHACWRTISEFVVVKRRAEAEAPPAKPGHRPRRRAAVQEPKPCLTQEEFARRSAAAEAAANALIQEEAYKKSAEARKAARKAARYQRRARAGPAEDSQAAATPENDTGEQEDAPGEREEHTVDAEGDEGDLVEPEWLAALLQEYDVRGSEAQCFVEARVRAAPVLAAQLAAIQRCAVCLDSPRGALLTPCQHALFCIACAKRVVSEALKCPVCAGNVTGWSNVFL
jgi:ankyrin repeat protein